MGDSGGRRGWAWVGLRYLGRPVAPRPQVVAVVSACLRSYVGGGGQCRPPLWWLG